jgi:hypothetical protein
MPYFHFDPSVKFIKISFKDFTEERLAKILNDIYMMAIEESMDGYLSRDN